MQGSHATALRQEEHPCDPGELYLLSMHKSSCSQFPAGHGGALFCTLRFRCFFANPSLLKPAKFYKGVIPSVPSILPVIPNSSNFMYIYLLALFTAYGLMIKILCFYVWSRATACLAQPITTMAYNYTRPITG